MLFSASRRKKGPQRSPEKHMYRTAESFACTHVRKKDYDDVDGHSGGSRTWSRGARIWLQVDKRGKGKTPNDGPTSVMNPTGCFGRCIFDMQTSAAWIIWRKRRERTAAGFRRLSGRSRQTGRKADKHYCFTVQHTLARSAYSSFAWGAPSGAGIRQRSDKPSLNLAKVLNIGPGTPMTPVGEANGSKPSSIWACSPESWCSLIRLIWKRRFGR